MKALTRKLLRDIGNMRGAVFTISLVVAAGIAAFVTLRGTYNALVQTRDIYYSKQRFGDVFSELERAPLHVVDEIAQLKGVARVYARVTGSARVPLASLPEPAQARVLSIPEEGPPALNGIQLMAGRLPENDRDDEALLIELFASKHDVHPGSQLKVVIEGRERILRIVGIAMSPEFVLAVPNGASAPAPERFAVFWMRRPAVEAAFDMRASFNSVVLDLAPGVRAEQVVQKLDELLDRHGGLGAYARARQISNYFLSQDLGSLSTLATIAPLIFLGVAAFLLNVVLSRLVELDRPQIATLKAIGYSDREVGFHYLELTLLISTAGALVGIALGGWLGAQMTHLYQRFYRMPHLEFRLELGLLLTAFLVSLGAGLLGSFVSVRRVMLLPPAEAMRPAAPPSYAKKSALGGITALFGTASRMIVREVIRRPMRTLFSALGIGAATGIIIIGQHFTDAMDYLVDFYLQAQQRETIAVSFLNPISADSAGFLKSLPGVRDVQWLSSIQVRVRAGHRERTVGLIGRHERGSLRPLLDSNGRARQLAPGDVLFTDMLAKALQVKPGDTVYAEPLIGDRTPRPLKLTGTVSELMALWIHMPADDLQRWLGTETMIVGAAMLVDREHVARVQDELMKMPQVANATRKELIISDAVLGERVARGELEAARAVLASLSGGAQAGGKLSLSAPVAGPVLRVFQESAGVVQAGTPLLEIGDPNTMEITVDVLSMDAVRIERGAEALIERWGGDHALKARVREKQPAAFTTRSALGVEEQRVPVRLDLVDPREQWKALGDGYRVEARIRIAYIKDTVVTPTSALFRENGGYSAFLVKAGKAKKTKVEIGARTPDWAEVKSGVAVGDVLVLYPSDTVVDGVKVSE